MSKRNNIIYWVATIWLSLGMISTGILQLLKVDAGQAGAQMIRHLGYPVYMLTLLGVCKLMGVVALLIPRRPLIKEWAYAGFFFMMTGALCSHLAAGDPAAELFPSLLLLVLTVISWYFRSAEKKLVLVNK